jgi:hypothetical protein
MKCDCQEGVLQLILRRRNQLEHSVPGVVKASQVFHVWFHPDFASSLVAGGKSNAYMAAKCAITVYKLC